MRRGAVLLLAVLGQLPGACRPQHGAATAKADAAELVARSSRFQQRLAVAAGSKPNEALARWVMPRDMREISGLALTADGRLFAENDEDARIYVFDPVRGEVLKKFFVGKPTIHGDFEAITVSGDAIYLLASNGVIVQFDEGGDGQHVPYSVHDTHLGRECEFEGLAFDSTSGSLLMPCKNVYRKNMRGQLLIYRWKLHPSAKDSSSGLTTMTIPVDRLAGANGWHDVHPSDITIDPTTGHWLILLSHEKGLVEITPTGDVVRSISLPGKHAQPEGIALSRGGVLMISDEASHQSPAAITLYHWPLAADSPLQR